MSSEQFFSFVTFAFVAAVTPGPSNIILASIGANAGVRRGLPCLFGTTLGMGSMMFLVALGLGSLIQQWPMLQSVAQWVAVFFLIWLAFKIATSTRSTTTDRSPIMGFWPAASFQWVNPKSWLVSASAAGAFISGAGVSTTMQAALLGLIFALIALPCCLLWLAAGASLQQLLRTDRTMRLFNWAMAALLAVSVLFLVQ